MDSKAIEQEALHLSLEDRAQFAQKLLLSLDALSDEELEDMADGGQSPISRA